MITLGCAKNQVDAEFMAADLLRHGFTFVADPGEAEVIVLNTCAFIQDAVRESLNAARDLAHYRVEGRCRCLVLAGCLVQRFQEDLLEKLPEVDLFAGLPAMARIGSILAQHMREKGSTRLIPHPPTRPQGDPGGLLPGERLAPGPWAYVKIAEGCSNRCSYCTLPEIRGPMRSRGPTEILEEVARLAELGVLEINLVAQDVAAYGRDRGARTSRPLARLLGRIQRIESIRWIRLLYCHPAHVQDELIGVVGDLEKVCPYLDLPIQHVSTPVLKAMRRPYRRADLVRLIERLRRARPEISLRTTVMVGFPGETERDFDELLRFLQDARFHHVGAFCYSPEPGTPAHGLTLSLPRGEAQRRRRAVLKLQSQISREIQRQFVGTVQEVLIDGVQEDGDLLRGRTRFQAPEVDGVVWIRGSSSWKPGLAQALITGARTYDLTGRIDSGPPEP